MAYVGKFPRFLGLGVLANGVLKFWNAANTHYTGFKVGTVTADTEFTLPDGDGVANQVLKTDGSGNLEWGSASGGSGEINYVTEANFEDAAVTGWTAYADAAGVVPVDATGGSPNITFTVNSTTPLNGVYDAKLAKDAANRQGEGASYALKIPPAYRNTMSKISIAYRTTAGYDAATEGVSVFMYNVDTGAVIYPVGYDAATPPRLPHNLSGGSIGFQFQPTNTTDDDYCLVLHVGLTGTAAWDLFVDDVVVGPGQLVQGSAVGVMDNTLTLTPAATAFGIVTGLKTRTQRVGNTLHAMGYWKNGTVSTGLATIALPTGLHLDTALLSSTAQTERLGFFAREVTGSVELITDAGKSGAIFYDGTNTDRVALTVHTLSNVFQNDQGADCGNTNDGIAFEFTVPIAEWSANMITGAEATEYLYNSSTSTTTSDTTSFMTGQSGAQIGAITAGLSRRVRSSRPVSGRDIVVQISPDGLNWMNAGGSPNGYGVDMFRSDGTNSVGVGPDLTITTTTSTDVDVNFGKYRTGTNSAWSNVATCFWRVKITSSPALIGHSMASATEVGLVSKEVSGTFSATFTQSGGYSQVATVRYSLVGKQVTLMITQFSATATSSSVITASAALPLFLRPVTKSYVMTSTRANGSYQAGVFGIDPSGDIVLYKTAAGDAFTAEHTGCGTTDAMTFTYNLL
jgi:hypothetical protein